MTERILTSYADKKQHQYEMLACCQSVPELLLKIAVYGDTWTKWDWILFFRYLANCFIYPSHRDGLNAKPDTLFADIIQTIDNEDTLDGILTNKTVIICFIESAEISWNEFHAVSYTVLAHIFKKFPSLWNMNFMWIRHKSSDIKKRKTRTHRLASSQSVLNRHTADEKADIENFICKYWKI